MLDGIAHFLSFMKSVGAPIPETRSDLNALLTRYIQTERREQMRRVSEERVTRGELPLPQRLLL